MSIKIMQEVWQHAEVTGGTLLVLLALADSADETTRTCFPGIENLAHKSRLSERQVKRVIAELTDLTMVHVDRNASPYKTNLYRISDPSNWRRSDNMSPTQENPIGHLRQARGDAHVTSDGTPMSPKPLVTSEETSDRARDDLFGEKPVAASVGEIRQKKADDRFPEFWSAYPRKDAKSEAIKAFQKAIKAGVDPDVIINGARRYAQYLASGKPGEFRPEAKYPQGWLNGKRWLDEAVTPSKKDKDAHPYADDAYFMSMVGNKVFR